MKKILRLSATMIGAFALVTGFTACNKDDDHGECCTLSGTYDGISYKATACADGTYSYSDSTGYSFTGKFSYVSDNWEYYKSYAVKNGGSCS